VFTHVSFGSILQEELTPILARMRMAVPRPIHAGCPSILLQDHLEALLEEHPGKTPEFLMIEPIWNETLYRSRNQ